MAKSAVPTRTVQVSAAHLDALAEYSEVCGVTVESAIDEALRDFIAVSVEARMTDFDSAPESEAADAQAL